MKNGLLPILCLAAAATGHAAETWQDQQRTQAWATQALQASALRHEWVRLTMGARTLSAFVTYPAGGQPAPAVLVLHEVFGLTDSTLATADAIAHLGYVTVAPDMLAGFAPDGSGTAGFPTTRLAGDFMTVLPDETINATLDAWAGYAMHLPGVDGRFAIAGLSWGGGAAFRYAAAPRHRPSLQAVFVFYDVGPPAVTQGPGRFGKAPGAVPAPIPVDAIDVPVYGFYPDRDTRVMASLDATRAAMAAARKPFDAVVYPGADHAYMRLGADPANADAANAANAANAAAVKASYTRLAGVLAAMRRSP